jgi:hypothetical protein
MEMKNLGTKQKKDIYQETTASNKETVSYPEVSFPLDFIEGINLKVDDTVSIQIEGRISGMEDTRWSKRVSFECKKGMITKSSDNKKSLLDEK